MTKCLKISDQAGRDGVSELPVLEKLKVPRCHKPNEIKTVEFHHFFPTPARMNMDSVRLTDRNDLIYCSLVMGKSRVAPLKLVTIPRLELTAAVFASKIGCVLHKELECKEVKETYWTDNKTVMGYMKKMQEDFPSS